MTMVVTRSVRGIGHLREAIVRASLETTLLDSITEMYRLGSVAKIAPLTLFFNGVQIGPQI